MLRTHMEKVGNIQEKMGNEAKRWKLRKIQKEIVELKDTVTSMKNAFEELISKQNTAQEKNQWAWRNVDRNF